MSLPGLILSCLLVAADTSPKVQADTLDGKTLSGALVSLNGRQLVLDVDGRQQTLPLKELRRILIQGHRSPSPPAAVRVEMVDGSSLVASDYAAAGDEARCRRGDSAQTTFPLRMVRSVRLQAPSERTDQGWEEARAAAADGDRLVIRKDEEIDFLEGVLGEVDAQRVGFQLGGRTVRVPRERVEGLIYARTAAVDVPQSLARATLADGSQLVLSSLVSDGDTLRLAGPSGWKFSLPAAEVRSLDFSQSNVVYLSDLKPQSVEWTPLVGDPELSATLAKAAQPRRDEALGGGPLRLGQQEYVKGLALRSRTQMVYRLPDGLKAFRATVGIDDRVRPGGNVKLTILADDRPLFDAAIDGDDEPKTVSLDVTGASRLTLVVDFGEDDDVADHLDLGDARLTK